MTTTARQKAAESVPTTRHDGSVDTWIQCASCRATWRVQHAHPENECPAVIAVLPWVEKCEELEALCKSLKESTSELNRLERAQRARADAAEKRCREVAAVLRSRRTSGMAHQLNELADRLEPREG